MSFIELGFLLLLFQMWEVTVQTVALKLRQLKLNQAADILDMYRSQS